jgi:two-component system response regulator HydG
LLASHFLERYAVGTRSRVQGFAPEALDRLAAHTWPGNVRELENTIERAVVLTQGTLLDEIDLPESIVAETRDAHEITIALGTPLEEIERRVIRETLRLTHGDKRRAAQLLGIATRTIYRKVGAAPDPE